MFMEVGKNRQCTALVVPSRKSWPPNDTLFTLSTINLSKSTEGLLCGKMEVFLNH